MIWVGKAVGGVLGLVAGGYVGSAVGILVKSCLRRMS